MNKLVPDSSPTPRSEQVRWFSEEVMAHDSVLRAYLRGSFRSLRDVDDIAQESYLRVWKVRLAQPILSAKSILFQIARRLAIDAVRHARSEPERVSGDISSLSVTDQEPDAVEALSYREKVSLVADALSALPKGCRNIVILRKFEGLSQREVADRCGLSERTVESQLARGMKLCEKYLRQRGIRSFCGDE